jgi:glycosyltransferase 2 family protein
MEGSEELGRSGAEGDAMTIEAAGLPDALEPEAREILPHGLRGWLGAALSVALFAGALFFLGRIIANLRFEEFIAALKATPARSFLFAVAATLASYTALLGYDLLALHVLDRRPPLRVTALASLAGNAFSFTLGFPLVTGVATRYWIYSKVGLSAREVVTITLFATLTFWLGMAALAALGLVLGARSLATINHLPWLANVAAGLLLFCGLYAYGVFVAGKRRVLRLFGGSLQLPGPRVFLGQLAVGIADFGGAAATLYALLSPESQSIGLPALGTVYVAAAIMGGASHAPGGIGVFEAFMLGVLLAPSQESLLAALLLFRIIYYIVPFSVATLLIARQGGKNRYAELREVFYRLLRRKGPS